jgi:hypothetical protein
MVESNNLDDMFSTLRNTEPYLADNGFTSGVLARLPEAKQLPAWLTSLIMLVFTAIGSAIAASQAPLVEKFSFMELLSLATSSLVSLTTLGIAAISTFVISYIIIWLAQNDSI